MESLRELIARILETDEGKINDKSSPENTENWDSFNGLMMVSELEKNFNVKFSIEEVMDVKSVADIKKALRKHGVREKLDD